ncbi:hypothetical protein HHK36_021364 [Tetracentron sinense]|uniref:Uncharacterized protein n=1 Tax=Tetracentron sinense TaxID=13715 RepID=A0A835D703_TETSI|nr:hypothetical protein HHK36_021364 [Tetracentron sinense]
MVRRTGELSSLLLVVACMAMFVTFGQANIEPSYDQVDLFGLDPEVGQCLASLQTIEGCVEEVLTSFLSNQVGLIVTMVRRKGELSSLLLVVVYMAMFVAFGQANLEPSYDQSGFVWSRPRDRAMLSVPPNHGRVHGRGPDLVLEQSSWLDRSQMLSGHY